MTSVVPDYKAYARLVRDDRAREGTVANKLDRLLALSKDIESPLIRELKPAVAVALKWKFDFLAKRLESPFELERDIDYWIDCFRMLKTLGGQKWFPPGQGGPPMDVWDRTAQAFDVGWTTTTRGERFRASQQIARERLDQILEILGGEGWVKGKDILDSGCGPGRYVDLLRPLAPRKIVAFDQGARLVDALKERFAGDPAVTIFQGTCEKLECPDASFDFVISNGVLHHTRSDLRTMIADHARVLRPGGVMFIMLVGKGGLELKVWEFLRAFLHGVSIDAMLHRFEDIISPLRLQGIVDHMYGEYQETDRDTFEGWCAPLFSRLQRVPGIAGLDVTPEIYADDTYFTARFGCGHLRYLCYK
jgi:SAM-dependent methyltransferase